MKHQVALDLARSRTGVRYGFNCCIVILVLVAIAGCGGTTSGPEREAVSGTVTREGIPVDNGTILFKPTGGGPAASTSVKDGKYAFDKQNGPVAGRQQVEIVQFPLRAEVPPGTPKKDAPVLPETRFKKPMPASGWVQEAEIIAGHDAPLDFKID
ncbi:MAG: hypothetical protein JWN70_4430 [Planctomycetaceae bacterium]|nr:hypothetical protein [Planctomycetaceae bacterium]